MARYNEIESLKAQVAALAHENHLLKARLSVLEEKQPPEPKPLMLDDLKVYGAVRPNLSTPDESHMPSRDELKALARIVAARYPSLVEFTQDWLHDFRLAMLAVSQAGRASRPNHDFGKSIGKWLEDHRHYDGLPRGPLMAAIAASGDIIFSGFADADALQGVLPAAAIASSDRGSPPDRSAWKKVLLEGRLLGESVAARLMERRSDRWDNPRSTVVPMPEYDRR